MIRQRASLAAVGAIVATTALTAGLASPANAVDTLFDPTFVPTATDLVGVGSDTSEIAMDYLSKGHNGVDGFNAANPTTRIASWAAAGTPTSISLREGHANIARSTINGSGNGKKALFGTTNIADVNFARSSSSLNPAETTADLRQAPFAVDGLKLAVSSAATNAPAAITPTQMVAIYKGEITNWSEVGGSAGVIKPLTPQPGSGTRSFWDAQLRAANLGVSVVYGSAVGETQEHSVTDIEGNPNAIAPFSTGRAKSATTIKTLDGAGSFSAQRALYNVFRLADLSGPNATLIDNAFGEGGFICSSAAKPLIEAAGFDQLATTSRGGVCGDLTQSATSNFKDSTEAADATTTTLAAEALNDHKMKLTATVVGANPLADAPDGSVVFKEDGDTVATEMVTRDSADINKAVANLQEVASGAHTYTATFVPDDDGLFKTSTSTPESSTMLKSSQVTVSQFPATGAFGAFRLVSVHATRDDEPATGNVSVKIGSAEATNVELIDGSISVVVPTNTPVGTHAIVATLPAVDGVFADTAPAANLVVTKASTTTSFKFSDATIAATSRAKANVTVSITGSSVKPGGKIILKSGSTTVATGTVVNGKVTIMLKALKKGTYSIKATFTPTSGADSANYSGSTSSSVTLKVS